MKKIIAVLIAVLWLFSCSVGAAAEAYYPNTRSSSKRSVTFSFDTVSGKQGDLVTVNFSLDTENSDITNGDIDFIYNKELLEEVRDEELDKFFVMGDVLYNCTYADNQENLKIAFATMNKIKRKGVVVAFTFRLLQDVEEPQKVMSCRIRNLSYEDDYTREFDTITVNNCWEAHPFTTDKNAMWANVLEVEVGNAEGSFGDLVYITVEVKQTQTYLKEFAVKLLYDTEKLRVAPMEQPYELDEVLQNGGNGTFDSQTGIFHYQRETGLTEPCKMTFVLEIAEDVVASELVTVGLEFTQPPVHGLDVTVEYIPQVKNGVVSIEPIPYRYVLTENGMKLVGCNTNSTSYRVPSAVDGETVTEIGENAFAGSPFMQKVTVTNYVTIIHPTAFEGVQEDFVLRGGENSAAQAFAKEHGIAFQVAPEVAEVVTGTDVYAPGDLDKDGYYTAKDALEILKKAVGKGNLTPGQEAAANVNQDAKIDAKDALVVLKRAVGKVA